MSESLGETDLSIFIQFSELKQRNTLDFIPRLSFTGCAKCKYVACLTIKEIGLVDSTFNSIIFKFTHDGFHNMGHTKLQKKKITLFVTVLSAEH